MGSTVFSSIIFRDMFGTAEMREVFSDTALVGHFLAVEAALARAQGRCGVIPELAAATIDAVARTISVDFERLKTETLVVGYPILPLVRQLSSAAGDSGRYVHWGATTQDIMDTASVLQIGRALDLVERDLHEIREILAGLAIQHRETPMAGRTHLQHALPITFGYKIAVWLSSVDRHLVRIAEARPRILMGQYSGAVGTLASLGDVGLEVQKAFCRELNLEQPPISWHVARDGIAEAITLVGLITATLGKIATDVMLMSSTEFGEVQEPFVPSRGASSTMPQKQNPISAELILAAAKAVRQQVALGLDAMIHDFERATGPWHLEWLAIPESFLLGASSLANAKFLLAGIVVNKHRMRKNLDLTGGLIVAEAVMMAAAGKLGRQNAHDLVYEACRQAIEHGTTLEEAIQDRSEIVDAIGAETLRQLCDPTEYLGLSGEMVDRVVGSLA